MVLKISLALFLFVGFLATGCTSKPKVTNVNGNHSYGPGALGVAEEKNFFGYKIQEMTRPDGTTSDVIWY